MSILERPYGLASLTESLQGSVVFPDHPSWDAAREAYNLAVDQQPEAIAFPADARDVQEIVRYAAAKGFRVAPQRTGHNASPIESLAGVILLKTDRLDEVTIDRDALRARVGAGVKWEKVVPRASELGLAALHGSTPDVSIAGYGLGGGLGWYGRKHGLFTNSITAIELVTADGELRRVDADNEPELFWALRGGGGNFGVVTALEFRLFPISEVYAGALFFPWERSAEVLHAWRNWIRTVPDEVTSVGRILQFPPIDEVPEPMRGKSFAIVHAYSLGTEAEGIERLAPLRALGPEIDTVADGAAGRALRDAHGPARSAAVLRRASRAPRPAGRGDRRRRRCRRAGVGLDARRRSRSGTWAARSAAAARGTVPSTSCRASSSTSASGWPPTTLEDAATRRDLHRVTGALRPLPVRELPQLRGGGGRRRELLRRGDVPPAPRREGRRRPGRAVPGEPPRSRPADRT